MSCEVYANSDEIACKAGDGKVIAAFPDVCLTPPPPPAGPIPVPYPDTSFSKDMQNGSKTVKIKGKEVMLKDSSFYKSSPLGDEAATNSQGAGVITHVITGKTYFVSWSMDVKFEDQNVDRHTDMTTSNHASPMANGQPPMANIAMVAAPKQLSLLCECCNLLPPHSKAQARGESISEEEFYGPTQTGARKKTGKGGKTEMAPRALTPGEKATVQAAQNTVEYARTADNGKCKDQVPPKPPGDDPCNKYYRNTAAENEAARADFDDLNNKNNPNRPSSFSAPGVSKIAHRVPLSAGGCPVGPNLHPVADKDCAALEDLLGEAQHAVAKIGRAQTG